MPELPELYHGWHGSITSKQLLDDLYKLIDVDHPSTRVENSANFYLR